MNKAMAEQKMLAHEQILVKARILKLEQEEQKAKKRIQDSLRQQEFMKKMHEQKRDKARQIAELKEQLRLEEESNRNFIRNHKRATTLTIRNQRKSVFDQN